MNKPLQLPPPSPPVRHGFGGEDSQPRLERPSAMIPTSPDTYSPSSFRPYYSPNTTTNSASGPNPLMLGHNTTSTALQRTLQPSRFHTPPTYSSSSSAAAAHQPRGVALRQEEGGVMLVVGQSHSAGAAIPTTRVMAAAARTTPPSSGAIGGGVTIHFSAANQQQPTTPPSLPGENGLHTRDGSLMRKKREQWAKERAEAASTPQWFPFGQPQATTPNFQLYGRHSVRRKAVPAAAGTTPPQCINDNHDDPHQISSGQQSSANSHKHSTPSSTTAAAAAATADLTTYSSPHSTPQQKFFQPPNLPATSIEQQQAEAASTPQWFPCVPALPDGGWRQLPATGSVPNLRGAVEEEVEVPSPFSQIPTPAATFDYGYYSCSSGQAGGSSIGGGGGTMISLLESGGSVVNHTSSNNNICNSNGGGDGYKSAMGMDEYAAAAMAILNTSSPSMVQRRIQQLEALQNGHCGGSREQPLQKRNTTPAKNGHHELDEKVLAEQVAERQRQEALQAELEREEARRAEAARRELDARQRLAAEAESERLRRAKEAQEANEREFASGSSWERARVEAEVLRKARLFKHVLMAEETSEGEVHRLLGTDDPSLVAQAMRELGALERQKRIEKEVTAVFGSHPSIPSPKSPAAMTIITAGGASSPKVPPSTGNSTTPNFTLTLGENSCAGNKQKNTTATPALAKSCPTTRLRRHPSPLSGGRRTTMTTTPMTSTARTSSPPLALTNYGRHSLRSAKSASRNTPSTGKLNQQVKLKPSPQPKSTPKIIAPLSSAQKSEKSEETRNTRTLGKEAERKIDQKGENPPRRQIKQLSLREEDEEAEARRRRRSASREKKEKRRSSRLNENDTHYNGGAFSPKASSSTPKSGGGDDADDERTMQPSNSRVGGILHYATRQQQQHHHDIYHEATLRLLQALPDDERDDYDEIGCEMRRLKMHADNEDGGGGSNGENEEVEERRGGGGKAAHKKAHMIGLFEPVRTRHLHNSDSSHNNSSSSSKEWRMVSEACRQVQIMEIPRNHHQHNGGDCANTTNTTTLPNQHHNGRQLLQPSITATPISTIRHNRSNGGGYCAMKEAEAKNGAEKKMGREEGMDTNAVLKNCIPLQEGEVGSSSTTHNHHHHSSSSPPSSESPPPSSGDYKSSSSMEIEPYSLAARLPPLIATPCGAFGGATTPLARKLAEQRHCHNAGYNSNLLFPESDAPTLPLRRQLVSPTMNMLRCWGNGGSTRNSRCASPAGSQTLDGREEDEGNEGSASGMMSFSRPQTPSRPFSRSSQYRSLNARCAKTAEKQNKILEQLAMVRAQLRERQQCIEETFSQRMQKVPPSTATSGGKSS